MVWILRETMKRTLRQAMEKTLRDTTV